MSERWLDFTKRAVSGGRVAAAYDSWSFTAPVLGLIREHVPPGGRVLDLGCGNALHDVLLEAWGFAVTGVDNDERILEEARATRTHFRCSFKVELADAFNLAPWHDAFDLVYSLGLIEHFERAESVALLREQARVAPLVLATIPTRAARVHEPQTDERSYGLRGFRRLFEDAEMEVVKAFPFGVLNTRTDLFLQRVLPGVVYRAVQYGLAYAPGLACLGRKR